MMDKKRIQKVILIEPSEKTYNIFSYVKMPKLGLPILGSVLKRHGFEVEIYVEKFASINWGKINEADLVGISAITQTALESYQCADKVTSLGIPVIMGGPHVSFEPDEALEHCDYVVKGEGEETLPELIAALNQGGDLKKIEGISFKSSEGITHNPWRKPSNNIAYSPDFTLIHGYKEYRGKYVTKMLNGGVIPIATSRGCPHTCSFCSVIKMFGRAYRTLTPDQVLAEIKHQVNATGSMKLFFADDNFAENKQRAKEILTRIIDEKLKLDIVAQIRLEAARDEELLKLMYKANLRYVFIGLESINPKTLAGFKKCQNKQDMIEAIQKLHKHKISIHGMFIVGTDDDDLDTVRQTVQFSMANRLDTMQLLSIMPLPGTELYQDLKSKNKLLTTNYSLYNGHYVVNLPDHISPSHLQREIIWGHKKFLGWRNILRDLMTGQGYCAIKFKIVGHFLGRKIYSEEVKHIKFLESIEKSISLDKMSHAYSTPFDLVQTLLDE
jgi:radical SAM superfamily enzyme YgiQ (UPF0313 family)